MLSIVITSVQHKSTPESALPSPFCAGTGVDRPESLDEASQGKSVARARKASRYIYSETLAGTPKEEKILKEIREILFPTGIQTPNQWNDVEIVFNAWKYKCILVTDDGGSKRQPGGILGNRERLAQLGIRVMSDSEAVNEVEEAIRKRDERAIQRASRTGEELPDWIGKDL